MDVDFIYDTETRVHSIELDGEHKALANFLNNEFSPNRKDTQRLSEFVTALEQTHGEICFSEWTIQLEAEEVQVMNNIQPDQKTDAEYHLMEWEYQFDCGKLDLLAILLDWIDFIEET